MHTGYLPRYIYQKLDTSFNFAKMAKKKQIKKELNDFQKSETDKAIAKKFLEDIIIKTDIQNKALEKVMKYK